jgi:multisubunit Na+/H+ antiporter MnhF subunit
MRVDKQAVVRKQSTVALDLMVSHLIVLVLLVATLVREAAVQDVTLTVALVRKDLSE